MARKRKILKNVKIDGIAAEGKGLARHEGRVVFVDYGIPGDVADVRLLKNKKDYALGVIEELQQPSELRQAAFCDHFLTCGGCRWQHISYEQQLAYKEAITYEAFRRTGKLDNYERLPIKGCAQTTAYRNKFEFTFSDRGWFTKEEIESGAELERRAVGFHVAGQYQKVVHVGHCHLQDERGNAIRNALYNFALEKGYTFYNHFRKTGFLRNLTMRLTSTGERMLLLHVAEEDIDSIREILDFAKAEFPEIDSLQYVINTKHNDTIYDLDVVLHSGKDHIVEELNGTRFRIGPKSFFQTNSAQAKVLYDIAVDFAGLKPDDLVYDLYTGIGTIALYIARHCRRVVGVETVPEAIEDAKKNAALNGIDNADFVAFRQQLNITGLGHGIATDINDALRSGFQDEGHHILMHARPRGIGDEDIRPPVFFKEAVGQDFFRGSGYEFCIINSI